MLVAIVLQWELIMRMWTQARAAAIAGVVSLAPNVTCATTVLLIILFVFLAKIRTVIFMA